MHFIFSNVLIQLPGCQHLIGFALVPWDALVIQIMDACFFFVCIRQSCVRPLSGSGIMATPRSVMVSLSGAFHKTVPKFPVEVCTTIRGCLSATRLQGDAASNMQFL